MPKLIQHYLNPLHVMCRLLTIMPFKAARKLSIIYDKTLWRLICERRRSREQGSVLIVVLDIAKINARVAVRRPLPTIHKKAGIS